MKTENAKISLALTILLGLPLTALAHGGEVLTTLFIELIFIIVFIAGLWAINLTAKGKLIVGSIYLLATLLTFSFINRFPYNENQVMINMVIFVVPWTIVALAYLGLKGKFQKARK